ncbi:hypothetical protein FRZ44_11090 [Hypericibacter terrae]|uniref:Uncharacterized protein n=1 Tax=Hypericibacter terrae TaxID=2602015 RepID=A0A5J6MEI3_9PROT|nr:hypothetical protein [Hypericibacter terrae]QEX15822.1 hypothetical protein FRZ44_11090 [Hypericibacter terrae]
MGANPANAVAAMLESIVIISGAESTPAAATAGLGGKNGKGDVDVMTVPDILMVSLEGR